MDWLQNLFTDENSIAHIVLLYSFVIAVGVLLGKIKIFGGVTGCNLRLVYRYCLWAFRFYGKHADFDILARFRTYFVRLLHWSSGGTVFFLFFQEGWCCHEPDSDWHCLSERCSCPRIVLWVERTYRIAHDGGCSLRCGYEYARLGAANEALSQLSYNGPQIAMGYACAYPLGVLGIIGSIIAIRYICRVNLKKKKKLLPGKRRLTLILLPE